MRKQKDLMLILGSSTLLVILWVLFSIYHNSVASTISQDTSMQISPIAPTFDNIGIARIKDRVEIIPLFDAQNAPIIIPEASQSSGFQDTVASESGQNQ